MYLMLMIIYLSAETTRYPIEKNGRKTLPSKGKLKSKTIWDDKHPIMKNERLSQTSREFVVSQNPNSVHLETCIETI